MQQTYLETILRSLVQKASRPRLLGLLASTKRYDDFLWELLHDPRHFEPACIVKIPPAQQTPSDVLRMLQQLGAGPQGYLVSATYNPIDGSVGELTELLQQCVGSSADVLVYCPRSNVAYYEGHEGWRYLLRRGH